MEGWKEKGGEKGGREEEHKGKDKEKDREKEKEKGRGARARGKRKRKKEKKEWAMEDSNPRPSDLESDAISAMLTALSFTHSHSLLFLLSLLSSQPLILSVHP